MNQQTAPLTTAGIVQDMIDLLSEIAKALVDDPESISVEAIESNDSTLLRLRVSQKDVGKIIGKQGRTARSLRTILGAASMKLQHRFALDILEHGEAPRSGSLPSPVFADEDGHEHQTS